MSDLWCNIRIGTFHIQCKLYSMIKWEISHNHYWANWKWLEKPFEICQFDWEYRKK